MQLGWKCLWIFMHFKLVVLKVISACKNAKQHSERRKTMMRSWVKTCRMKWVRERKIQNPDFLTIKTRNGSEHTRRQSKVPWEESLRAVKEEKNNNFEYFETENKNHKSHYSSPSMFISNIIRPFKTLCWSFF